MPPDRKYVVESFRQRLHASYFDMGQFNDDELESWLFCPGSDRIGLFSWCLVQIKPSLKEQFQSADGRGTEEKTVGYAKSFGFSHKLDVLLGKAEDKEQILMWSRVLLLLKASSKLEESSPVERMDSLTAREVASSLIHSKDLSDLCNLQMNLLPPFMKRKAISVAQKSIIQDELETASLKLEKMREAVKEKSLDENSVCNLTDHSKYSPEEEQEKLLQNKKKINECYEHIKTFILPHVKKQPHDPQAERLGRHLENIAGSTTAFVQMLKSTEEIHKLTEIIKSTKPQDFEIASDLLETLSKCHLLVTETLSLQRKLESKN